MMDEIREELKKGTTLICDRYAFSGVVYSAAKVSHFSHLKYDIYLFG